MTEQPALTEQSTLRRSSVAPLALVVAESTEEHGSQSSEVSQTSEVHGASSDAGPASPLASELPTRSGDTVAGTGSGGDGARLVNEEIRVEGLCAEELGGEEPGVRARALRSALKVESEVGFDHGVPEAAVHVRGRVDPFCGLIKSPSFTDNDSLTGYGIEVEHPEAASGVELVGTVGKDYLVVPNSDVVRLAQRLASSVAQATGVALEPVQLFFDGSRFSYTVAASREALARESATQGSLARGPAADHQGARLRLGERSVARVADRPLVLGRSPYGWLEVPDPSGRRVGDEVGVGLMFENSYDGSRALAVKLLVYRLVCANGMVAPTSLGTVSLKHVVGNRDEWLASVERTGEAVARAVATGGALEQVTRSLVRLKRLPITDRMLVALRGSYRDAGAGERRRGPLAQLPRQRYAEVLDRLTGYEAARWWDGEEGRDLEVQPLTAYDVLQAATAVLWHRGPGGRLPTAQSYGDNARVTEAFLAFAKAHRA